MIKVACVSDVRYSGSRTSLMRVCVLMGALICFSESLGQAPANEATPQVEGMDGSDSLLTISKQVDEVRVFFTVTLGKIGFRNPP